MRPGFRTPSGPRGTREGRPLELVRVRGAQRNPGDEGRNVSGKGRRRGGRGRGRGRNRSGTARTQSPRRLSLWAWLKRLLAPAPARAPHRTLSEQETRTLADFSRHFGLTFSDASLLKLALTHRSYLSVTGQGPRESNERLEFLGDSVLGLVTSEFLYRAHPDEHEGQLTKIKSLLVSKAILSRRALDMGLGRFVLMSHSEVESGGRQRLSILADAFEAVIGAIYIDQGFEPARTFIHQWLLKDTKAIAADERHANYKSHLQEYVQSTFHTHPVYRIRSEYGPDHSKHFMVDVMVGKRVLGSGRGRNKKEAEQAAARNALEQANAMPKPAELRERDLVETEEPIVALPPEVEMMDAAENKARRRGRRGGRGRRRGAETVETIDSAAPRAEETATERPDVIERSSRERQASPETRPAERPAPWVPERAEEAKEVEPRRRRRSWLGGDDDENDEVGRPEGPLAERHVDPYDWQGSEPSRDNERTTERDRAESAEASRDVEPAFEPRRAESAQSSHEDEDEDEPAMESRRAEQGSRDDEAVTEPRHAPRSSSDDEDETPAAREIDRDTDDPASRDRGQPAQPPPSLPRYGRRTRPRR